MDQKEISRLLAKRLPIVRPVPKVALEITGSCPGNCFHCYAYFLRGLPPMKFEEAKQTIDTIVSVGYQQIYIAGGEPMTHPNIIDICQYAKDKGLLTILVTNGFRLDNLEIARKICHSVSHVEISVRSDNPKIHNRIVAGKGIYENIEIIETIPAGYKNAMDAFKVLDKARTIEHQNIHLAVNHDLYSDKIHTQERDGVPYAIAKQIFNMGVQLNGFYLQLLTLAGRAKQNLKLIKDMQVPKEEFIKALQDLETLKDEFNVTNIHVTDDPVKCGVISSLNQIPKQYRYLIISENVPAINILGMKPIVEEDLLKMI